ncbi:DsbA family oxidoreductase [Cellulomonas shaoxiangyii]|uniref:DsbA family oxidoreductase n=1 Tax=Cellulomonas shaoxiangyii TaxID=2566013 RepID=A0A4P7SQM1_9CELL|nr:DsbA family oxidoreductase [Cellulomonas shaoxiangyii]TGY84601.1 DsbA family oxidoreductase [Cellulomonas shaoxiangyii]
MRVEVWSDVACPWCFIGKRRFAAALERFEHRAHVDVVWRSYQLSPETPAGPGRPEVEALARMKGLDPAQVRQMFAQVTAVAAGDGLRYDFDRTLAFNTFDAHRLLHLAARAGGAPLADATMEALFSAHFEQGADLGADGALVSLAARVGFADHGWDEDRVAAALAGDDEAAAVRADIDEARALGVTGVPFFVVDRKYAVSGAQPAEVLAQLLDAGWREANPLTTLASGDACTDATC